MRKRVIILINQASHVLERGRTLLIRGQQELKDPARLPHETEVGKITGPTLLVCRRKDSYECRFAVEAHVPAV